MMFPLHNVDLFFGYFMQIIQEDQCKVQGGMWWRLTFFDTFQRIGCIWPFNICSDLCLRCYEYSMTATLKTSSCEYCRLQQWILEFSTVIVVIWIMTLRITHIKACTLFGSVSLTLCFVSVCFGTFDFTVNKLLLKVIKQWKKISEQHGLMHHDAFWLRA